jgi:hypothetical protein
MECVNSLKIKDDKDRGIFITDAEYKHIRTMEDVNEMLLLLPQSTFCKTLEKKLNCYDSSLYDNGNVVVALEIRNLSECGMLCIVISIYLCYIIIIFQELSFQRIAQRV